MSSLLPVNYASIIKRSNVLLLHLNYQFVSWCLRLPSAEIEDTHPIIFQNGFDVSVLKTRYFRKIPNN